MSRCSPIKSDKRKIAVQDSHKVRRNKLRNSISRIVDSLSVKAARWKPNWFPWCWISEVIPAGEISWNSCHDKPIRTSVMNAANISQYPYRSHERPRRMPKIELGEEPQWTPYDSQIKGVKTAHWEIYTSNDLIVLRPISLTTRWFIFSGLYKKRPTLWP